MEFKKLIEDLALIQDFIEKNKIIIDFNNEEKINSFKNNKKIDLREKINKEILNDENKEILNDFVSRMEDQITIIAYHSAAARSSKIVELCDFEYSFDFWNKCFNLMMIWVEETIIPDFKIQNYKLFSKFKKIEQILIDNNKKMLKIDLIKKIQEKFGINSANSYVLFNKYFSKGIITEEGKERKKFIILIKIL